MAESQTLTVSHFQCFAACPANTEWVVVSNGDNDYAKTFFSRIGAVKDADVIAFDFYSRYHRATGASQPPASCTVHRTHHVQAYDCHEEAAASEPWCTECSLLHLAHCAALPTSTLPFSNLCANVPASQAGFTLSAALSVACIAGVPCERFGQQEGAPTCKLNKLRWCHTDLGANAMRWPRLMAEDRRFGSLNAL